MDFLPEPIQEYALHHTTPESELLHRIHRETHLQVLKPRMLSGHLQGRVLSMISHMLRPNSILEIGTYTGYSALCLAEGLSPKGKIITIDINEELAPRVQRYFAESRYASQIEFLIDDARAIIPSLTDVWDLVFIDADKESYPVYFEMVLPQVRQGGFIVIDNVLWSGKVADKTATDKATESIRAFNRQVHEHAGVENVLLPVRDGLMILRKV